MAFLFGEGGVLSIRFFFFKFSVGLKGFCHWNQSDLFLFLSEYIATLVAMAYENVKYKRNDALSLWHQQ